MDFKQKASDLLTLLKTQRKYQLGAGVVFFMIMFLVMSDGKPARKPPIKAHKGTEVKLSETLGRKEAYDDLIEAFKSDMESVKTDIGGLRQSSEENSKRIEEYQARTADIFKKIIERQADTESKMFVSASGSGVSPDSSGPVDVNMNRDNTSASALSSDDGLAEFGDRAEPLPPPPPAPGKIAYIGAGDSVQVKLLQGVRAPTEGNPYPVILKLTSDILGPDGSALPLGEARVIAAAQGSLVDQRVLFRLTSLSLRFPNGKRKVIDIDGWVVGEDGILGMEGILIDPIGKSIGAAALTGFVGGMGDALSNSQLTTRETGNYLGSTTTASTLTGNMAPYALGQGVSDASDKWQQIVEERARKLTPLVEVFSGREATAVFAKSVSIPELLDALGEEDNTMASID